MFVGEAFCCNCHEVVGTSPLIPLGPCKKCGSTRFHKGTPAKMRHALRMVRALASSIPEHNESTFYKTPD